MGGWVYNIFVINPGSTSTKIAFFNDDKKVVDHTLYHTSQSLSRLETVTEQFNYRCQEIEKIVASQNIQLSSIHAFVARGGLIRPIPSGTYFIDEIMLSDLLDGAMGFHASNLGALIAHYFALPFKKPAFIVDPVVVDEMTEVARFSGHPLLPRRSIFHALNQKAVGRKLAEKLNRPYNKVNLIVAHLGGGISVGAHKIGRVIDVNNALDGEGPFSPERSGTLPVGDLVRLCFSKKYTQEEICSFIKGNGGVSAYLGTNSMQDLHLMCQKEKAAYNVYKAMAYQIAKEIGAMSTVLKGKVDAIGITGGIAYDLNFVQLIKKSVSFIAPIYVFPGEEEMEALALGALRVLRKESTAKHYQSTIVEQT